MSTLASLVLVSSSAIAIDLVQGIAPFWQEEYFNLNETIMVLFVGLSVYIALKPTIVSLMASWHGGRGFSGCLCLWPFLEGDYQGWCLGGSVIRISYFDRLFFILWIRCGIDSYDWCRSYGNTFTGSSFSQPFIAKVFSGSFEQSVWSFNPGIKIH